MSYSRLEFKFMSDNNFRSVKKVTEPNCRNCKYCCTMMKDGVRCYYCHQHVQNLGPEEISFKVEGLKICKKFKNK